MSGCTNRSGGCGRRASTCASAAGASEAVNSANSARTAALWGAGSSPKTATAWADAGASGGRRVRPDRVALEQVVERKQSGRARSEVRGHPVEPVQARERRAGHRLGGDLGGIEERIRKRRRTCHQPGSLLGPQRCEQRLEELARDAVGKR